MLYINAYLKEMILTRKLEILKQLSDQNLTQLISLFSNLFTSKEVPKNLSTKRFSLEELNILKFGLNHSLPLFNLRKTDVFVSFEMINRFLREDLKNDAGNPTLKAQLSHLANSYIYNYQPSRSTLTKIAF